MPGLSEYDTIVHHFSTRSVLFTAAILNSSCKFLNPPLTLCYLDHNISVLLEIIGTSSYHLNFLATKMMFPLVVYIILSSLLSITTCLHLEPHNVDSHLLPSYDYIIVGGGTSGLVVANRLTEDRNGMASLIYGSNFLSPSFPLTCFGSYRIGP